MYYVPINEILSHGGERHALVNLEHIVAIAEHDTGTILYAEIAPGGTGERGQIFILARDPLEYFLDLCCPVLADGEIALPKLPVKKPASAKTQATQGKADPARPEITTPPSTGKANEKTAAPDAA